MLTDERRQYYEQKIKEFNVAKPPQKPQFSDEIDIDRLRSLAQSAKMPEPSGIDGFDTQPTGFFGKVGQFIAGGAKEIAGGLTAPLPGQFGEKLLEKGVKQVTESIAGTPKQPSALGAAAERAVTGFEQGEALAEDSASKILEKYETGNFGQKLAAIAQMPLVILQASALPTGRAVAGAVSPILEPLAKAEKIASTKTAEFIRSKLPASLDEGIQSFNDTWEEIEGLIPPESKEQLMRNIEALMTVIGVAQAPQLISLLGKAGAVPDMVRNFSESRKNAKFTTLKKDITADVESFIEGNKSFSRRANELKKGNTDIKEILSDPHIFKGLEVKENTVNPDAAIETVRGRIDLLMDAKSSVLPEVSKWTPSVSKEAAFRTRAIEYLKTEGLTPADAAGAVSRLDAQLAALPDELSIVQLDQLRAQARTSARNAKGQQKPHSEYSALENAARDTVFDATDNLMIENKGEFAALNQRIKNLIETEKFLDKNIRGAKVKGGRVGKITGRLIGAVAGSPGGILGTILGQEVGAALADIVTNNALGSSLKMRLIRNMVDDPAILSQIESLVKEVQGYEPKLLGSPKSDFRTQQMGGKTIKLPSKSQSTIDI